MSAKPNVNNQQNRSEMADKIDIDEAKSYIYEISQVKVKVVALIVSRILQNLPL